MAAPKQKRRKPRTPYPYVLQADRELPEGDRPRFIIVPPTDRVWADLMDAASGNHGVLLDAVITCVDRLENDPEATEFGTAGSEARKTYVDEMDITVIRELGNEIAGTLLSETDRKN
jgi:hypothetical protein